MDRGRSAGAAVDWSSVAAAAEQGQFAQLERELGRARLGGPALAPEPLTTVIGRRFHLTYTIQGVRKLLVRNGWSCQVPARLAMEQDDDGVIGWVKELWPYAEGSRWPVEPGSSSKTKLVLHDAAALRDLGQTWAHSGGKGPWPLPQTVSIAALTCYKPGHSPG